MTTLAAFLYESPAVVALGPVWSALFVGFALIGTDGQLYLTAAGSKYLEGLEK